MLKKILIGVAVSLSIAVAVLGYFAWPFIRGPQFTVTNLSSAPVNVEASWRTSTKQLGELASNESVRFRVKDEGGMVFTASFSDGRKKSSAPEYFTSGTTVEAVITNTEIKVSSEFGT